MHGWAAIYWSKNNFSMATLLKKTVLPPTTVNYQYYHREGEGEGLMGSSPIYGKVLMGPVLYKYYADSHIFCEFMSRS